MPSAQFSDFRVEWCIFFGSTSRMMALHTFQRLLMLLVDESPVKVRQKNSSSQSDLALFKGFYLRNDRNDRITSGVNCFV